MKLINWFKRNYILTAILLVGAFLRFYHSDFQSIWLDEILSMNEANPKLTLGEFYDKVMFFEFIPHLYFLLLRTSFELFGFTTLVGRNLSALIGVIGIYAIYLLAKELFNKKTGLIAAALLCVNVFHIAYSQEIRPYSLLFLFTILSFYRLSVFLKNPTIKNAIFYGLFTGLILNAHFFGFITVFAQYLILLFFLIMVPKEEKKKFFINSFISGIITLLVFLPALSAFMRITEMDSFWLQKPGPEAYTIMFREFFGSSEMVLFLINAIAIYYVVNLFRAKLTAPDSKSIIDNKLIFSFILLFSWLFISLLLPLIKSYLDVPMILSRYFINILPALLLIIAIGILYIRNNVVKITVVCCFVIFSLTDIFVVKNYYNTVTKSQYRELANEIIKRNPDNSRLVVYWSWIIPYFFENEKQLFIEGRSLEDRVTAMRTGSVPLDSFWYMDANGRPYALSKEDEAYLNENFYVKENLNYFDAWAKYYVSKTVAIPKNDTRFSMALFKSATFDPQGNIAFYENANLVSEYFTLKKGNYELIIKGISQPAKPINNENAHLIIRLNGRELGELNLSENPAKSENTIKFNQDKDESVRLQIIYDNDVFENGQDRNAIITAISLKNK